MKVNTNIKKVSLAALVFVALLSPVVPVSAAPTTTAPATKSCDTGGINFFPRWYDGLCDASGNIISPNDLGQKANTTPGATQTSSDASTQTSNKFGAWLTIIALNVVQMLLFAVGYTSLGFIIYGGFKYMTSGDSSSGTQTARKTITNAVIGLVLSIMSVALVKFVAGAVQ